jgi:hypothetical protein
LLVHYGETGDREYGPAIRGCVVRLMGIELKIDALPFEQQDQGVGACASAAMWSALAKAARDAGMRTPTPYAVTAAATKNWLTDRALPAVSGLELGQLANAVRELGFAPYTVKVGKHADLFLWTLKVYLRSGIPAVLVLRDGGDYHAVAVAGRKAASGAPILLGAEPRVLRYGALKRIYVHDDRIGPYVKMDLNVITEDETVDIQLKRVLVDDPNDAKLTANTRINYAVYPLYPKLRLTAPDLAELASEVGPLFRMLVGAERATGLTVEGWFSQNGTYLSDLYELNTDPKRVETFVQQARLSRYVGVLRWFLDGEALADVVCDTTDIHRGATPYSPVLGIFFFNSRQVSAAEQAIGNLMPGALIV